MATPAESFLPDTRLSSVVMPEVFLFFRISFMIKLGCAPFFISHVTFPALEEAEHQQEKAGGCNSSGMLHNPVACMFNNWKTIVSKRKRCLSIHLV